MFRQNFYEFKRKLIVETLVLICWKTTIQGHINFLSKIINFADLYIVSYGSSTIYWASKMKIKSIVLNFYQDKNDDYYGIDNCTPIKSICGYHEYLK